MSIPNLFTTTKVARKDIALEDPKSPDIPQDVGYFKSLQYLNETVADFLGDRSGLRQSQDGNGTTSTSKLPEPPGFRLFSWSVSTQPIDLNPLSQPARVSCIPVQDTDDEARCRQERSKQVSIEGIEVLRGPRYPSSSKRNHIPEPVKPVESYNSELPNLIVAVKKPSVTTIIIEGVQFPRTKCCPVIPVSSLRNYADGSKRNHKKRRRWHHSNKLSKLSTSGNEAGSRRDTQKKGSSYFRLAY